MISSIIVQCEYLVLLQVIKSFTGNQSDYLDTTAINQIQ